MIVFLPDSLKEFVDEQVAKRGYGTGGEYVCDLVRKDADRMHLRGLMREGQASSTSASADTAYFETLRKRAR